MWWEKFTGKQRYAPLFQGAYPAAQEIASANAEMKQHTEIVKNDCHDIKMGFTNKHGIARLQHVARIENMIQHVPNVVFKVSPRPGRVPTYMLLEGDDGQPEYYIVIGGETWKDICAAALLLAYHVRHDHKVLRHYMHADRLPLPTVLTPLVWHKGYWTSWCRQEIDYARAILY